MRKVNAVLGAAVCILFIFCAVSCIIRLTGILPYDTVITRIAVWLLTALILVHAGIGIRLTAGTLAAVKKSGVYYPKENRMFRMRRISGFALMLPAAVHIVLYACSAEGLLPALTAALTIAAGTLHAILNIRPLLNSLGMRGNIAVYAIPFASAAAAAILCFVR